jgi:transposase-like protein
MATITTELLSEETKRDKRGRRITPAPRRAELVAAYRSSGLTMEAFARREGIKRTTLAKWAYLHGRRSPAVRFAELKVGVPLRPGWRYEVTLLNGLPVRIADAAALAELMALAKL